jgi:hypothetical protein
MPEKLKVSACKVESSGRAVLRQGSRTAEAARGDGNLGGRRVFVGRGKTDR